MYINFQIEFKEKYPQRRLWASKNEQNLKQNILIYVDATQDHSKGKIKLLGCLNLSMPNSKINNEWKSHKAKWKTINGIRKTIQF